MERESRFRRLKEFRQLAASESNIVYSRGRFANHRRRGEPTQFYIVTTSRGSTFRISERLLSQAELEVEELWQDYEMRSSGKSREEPRGTG